MTIEELMEALQDALEQGYDRDAEVRVMLDQYSPMEYEVGKVFPVEASEEYERREAFYVTTGYQLGYVAEHVMEEMP